VEYQQQRQWPHCLHCTFHTRALVLAWAKHGEDRQNGKRDNDRADTPAPHRTIGSQIVKDRTDLEDRGGREDAAGYEPRRADCIAQSRPARSSGQPDCHGDQDRDETGA